MPVLGAPNAPVVGTTPFVTVSVADPTEVPEHRLPVYMVKVTVPPAFALAPVSVAVSVTVPEGGITVAESWVDMEGECLTTVKTSLQRLGARMFLASPL